jgi:type VI secretion system secreted protein Hcp
LSRTLALVPPAVALVSQHVKADFSAFMKIDTIPGEVTDKGHEGWIQIDSASWAVSRAITMSGGGGSQQASAPTFTDLKVSKKIDSTSPKLFLSAVTNNPATVTVELLSTPPGDSSVKVYYRITLTNVLVSSLGSSAGAGAAGTEEIAFHFGTIKVESLNPAGTVVATATYNLSTGKTL